MTGKPQGTWLGHPRGLAILAGTEMWERLSFYGMRALLVGYLTTYLLLPGRIGQVLFEPQIRAFFEFLTGPLAPQPFASLIYGAYMGLIYATPILGGWLADRWFGQRRMAICGMLLMAAGHFMMAVESLLFPALLLLVVGGGFFKTSTSSQVGLLYSRDDSRRDAGYGLFYVGINLGAFLAPLVCGTLGEVLGWHYGFAAAGVGLLIALAIYLQGWRHLPPDSRGIPESTPRGPLTGEERRSIAALCLLVLPLTLYWACNEQQGNTIALWAMDHSDRGISLLGWRTEIPYTWIQSVNPVVIFVGTPLVLALWRRQGARQPRPASKMALGCLLMTAANLLMALAALQDGRTSWLWLAGYFLVMTVGEIYLYPVSLALFSRAAPLKIASLMMGINFLPNFLGGGFLGGWLGTFWDTMDKPAFFMMIAAIAAVAGLAIRLFGPQPYLEERR